MNKRFVVVITEPGRLNLWFGSNKSDKSLALLT